MRKGAFNMTNAMGNTQAKKNNGVNHYLNNSMMIRKKISNDITDNLTKSMESSMQLFCIQLLKNLARGDINANKTRKH